MIGHVPNELGEPEAGHRGDRVERQPAGRAESVERGAPLLGARELRLVGGDDLWSGGEIVRVRAELALDRLPVLDRVAAVRRIEIHEVYEQTSAFGVAQEA